VHDDDVPVPFIAYVLIAALPFLCATSGCSPRQAEPHPLVINDELLAVSAVPAMAEAMMCAECHAKEVEEWKGSQHANANRLVSVALDAKAFAGGPVLDHGGSRTEMRMEDGRFFFDYRFSNEVPQTFEAEAVIGITPLRQYLVSFPDGRLQTMDVSYDPRSNKWFNAFPDVRVPGDWGHWTGRSMTWNVQCAFCHTTGFEKNYDPIEDEYRSTWKAMGISCSQCHTLKGGSGFGGRGSGGRKLDESSGFEVRGSGFARPTPDEAEDGGEDGCPMVASGSLDGHPVTNAHHHLATMHNCASCHARREELFGTFKPGDDFHDHYRLTLPDSPGIFHHDGQVLDEDFEYASFMMSRMGHMGVSCQDCHNPHSGKLVAPLENNALCMQCHTPPGLRGATPINPAEHQFHDWGTPGGRCVDCHMPENVYMVRDWRRDHGFTSPDPRLTIEMGIPNSCNRCHTDQTPAWAEEWVNQWYGEKRMADRRARHRARAVAAYHEGHADAVTNLLAMAQSEEIDAWRAALVRMLAPWNGRRDVQAFLQTQLTNHYPLIRSAAVQALAGLRGAEMALDGMRDDSHALVRVDATLATLPGARGTPAYEEVFAYLRNISDQPAGALRNANVALEEGRTNDVAHWTEKMTDWDAAPSAAYMAGRVQFAAGLTGAGLSNMIASAERETGNAEFSYAVALALAETGGAGVRDWLEETVRRDENFGRAWYNLGLAYAGEEKLAEAVTALRRAEVLMPASGDAAFARATVHLRQGDRRAARNAALLALKRTPEHPQARMLLRQEFGE
jgi:predicted CXXCH cytochrome family protein